MTGKIIPAIAFRLAKGMRMKNVILFALGLFALSFFAIHEACSQPEEIDKQQIMQMIQDQVTTLQDLSTSLTQHNHSGGVKTNFSGTLWFKSPDKFKADILITDNAGHKSRSVSVYEGSILWQEQTDLQNHQVKVFKSIMQGGSLQAKEVMKQFNPKEQIQSLLKDYDVISVQKENDAQPGVYVLEMELKPHAAQRMKQLLEAFSPGANAAELIPDRATLYWNAASSYASKLMLYSKNHELQITTEYSDTQINTDIAAEIFTYKVPAEARVLDMSEIMAAEIRKKELDGPENELAGTLLPDFSLMNIFGGRIQRQDLKGKVAIINFWEPGNLYCEKVLPLLEQLYEESFDDEVQVITITNHAEKAMQAVEEYGYSFPVLIDKKGNILRQLKVSSVPRTFVIDTQSVIRAVYIDNHQNILTVLKDQIIKMTENEN